MPNPRRTNPNKKKNTSQRNGKQYTWFNKLNKSVNKFAENVAKTIGKNIVVKGSGAGKNGANRTNNSNNANHHQLSSGARQVQQNSINSIASNTWNAVKNNIIVKDSGYDSSQNRNPITVINPSTYASGHKTGQQLNYNEQKGLHDYYETVDGRVELEVDRIMNGENHSKEYNELVGDVNGFFDEDPDGNGIQYSVYYAPGGGKELKAWYDKYSVKVKRLNANTGKMEKVTTFKKNSPPPPVYDKQGKKVDISQKWKYYTTYDFAVNDAVEYEYKHPVYYAGTDPKAVDSFLDAFRADTKRGNDQNSAVVGYIKDYMINPLMKKDYKAFFINTLVNVGETLDYLGVGARAAMAGRVTLGGTHQNDFGKDGNVVWYDNSKEGKEAQRELIRLGAADLLTAGEGSLRRKGTTKDEIRARIKAAGLWEEYKALRNAYQNSKSGELGKVVNNVKSAYSDPTKNYYMKTGNIVTDIAGEIFSDPSLVVGGIAKAAASGGSKAVAKTAARTAVRGYLPKAIEITPELDKAIDRFASTMGSDLLTANRKNIDKRVSAFSEDLFSKGLLVPNESFTGVGNSADFLSQKISQLVKGSVDSTNFKVVKSINKLDRAIDMADMSLLKLTLPAPFLAVKGGKGLNKLYRRSLLKAFDSEMSKQFGESMSKAALKDLGTFKVSELEKLVDEMKTEPNYVDDVFNETISKAGSLSKLLQRNISDVIDGRKSYKEFDDTIDASVKSMTGVSSRSELEAYVESLLAGPLKENRAKYIQLYDSLMNSINTVKSMDKVLMEREVTLLGSELNKVNSIEELEVLANKYITRSAGVKYPEQLEELIRAKACEISGVVDKKVVDSIIADFERNHNVSVSAVKKAVDIPKTVSNNTKFGTHIDSALYPQVEALRRIIVDMSVNSGKKSVKSDSKVTKSETKVIDNGQKDVDPYADWLGERFNPDGTESEDFIEYKKFIDSIAEDSKNLNAVDPLVDAVNIFNVVESNYLKHLNILRNNVLFNTEGGLKSLPSIRKLEGSTDEGYSFKYIESAFTGGGISSKPYDFPVEVIDAVKCYKKVLHKIWFTGKPISESISKDIDRFNVLLIGLLENPASFSLSSFLKYIEDMKTMFPDVFGSSNVSKEAFPGVSSNVSNKYFKSLKSYFFRIDNIDNMDPEGLYDAIQDAIRDAYKAKGLAELSGKGSPIDDNFIMSLHEISNDLRKDLTTVISEDTRLHRWKMDKLAVFDEYMMDGRFRNVVDYLRAVDENGEPANEFSKALNKIKDVRCTPEELDSASESFKLMYDLSRKLDMIDYFNSFRSQLMAGGLDYRVQYKVLDTLFAITKGSPKNYLHKSLPQVEYFMNKLDTILNAEYGVRCSLDGARKLIKDRDTSLFEKFEKEEVDEISDWLDALVKDGHKNPINDVRVQMFYTVLKDPTMVTDYNIKARNGQPVAFLDIETTGLNKDICEITSIAVKKWNADVIDENFSLTQLRDFIEGCDEKRLVRNMADDDISKIPNSYFEDLFKDNPTVVQDRFASNGWVENYKKIYEIGSLSDERSILDGFNDIVDEISAGSVKAPTFVSHSQHGFDIPFIISRVGYWNDKIGASNIAPDKVKTVDYFGKSSRHTTDIRNASENTLARIRGIENDVLPTAEEREYIKECLVNLANNADKVTNNFKIIDPRELEHTLSTLKRTEVEEGSFGAEYLSGLANENFDRLLGPLENCSKDIGHARREFDRYIFGDPYRYDAETQVLHEYHNILKDFYKANPSRGYSFTSTDVYYDSKIARICFEEVAGSRTLCTDLNSMYIFAKEIKGTIDKDIASTAHEHLLPYKVVYDDIIEQVRDFAFQLPEYHHLSYLKNLAVPSTAVESYCVAKKLYDMVYKHFDEYSIEMYTDKPSTASIMNPEGLGLYSEIKGMKSDVDFTGFDRFGFINKFGVNEDLLSDSIYYLDHDCYSIYKNLDNTSEMYVQSFRSANFEQVKDYENASFQLTKRMRTMQTDTSLSEFSKYAKSKVAAVSNAYGLAKNIVGELSRHAATDADFWDSYGKFFDRLFKERYSQFSAYRMNRLIKDQDTFISDLAFSAGFRRVISINSEDKLHMNLVSLLEKKFKEYDDSLFSVTYESNHMVVQLKQEPLFRTDADGNRFVSFQGSTKEYAQVPEERILFEDYSELKYGVRLEYEYDIARIYNNLRDLYNEIDNLTGGASVGTMGILHRYGSERAIVDSFSTETRMNSLGIDFSMNERFWHNYNFDKSMLGDFDSSYKIGLTVDDFDFVLNAVKVLDEISGRVKSTEHYLDSLFSKSSECRVDKLLYTCSKEELLESLKLNDDIVVCRLVEDSHTESGFAVKQIHIQDAISIEEAAKTNSIFVPYDMYLDLVGHINDSQVTNTFLKAWMKFVHVGKVSMLMSFGLIIRNWIDATIKNAGAMDSLGYALSYEFEAAARLREVMRVQRKYGDIATEHDWKALNPSNKLSYTDYEHARQFMSDEAVSGGQALRSKQILKEWEVSGRENRVLSVGGYNTVGSKSDRLEYQDVKYVENMCKDAVLFNRKLFDDMSIEEYLRVFEQQKINPKQVLDADTRFKYDKISDELVKYKSKTSYIEGDVNRAYQKLTNFVLTPMSQTELIVRYSLLMGLEDMGLSRAGAYHEIVKTHFNYNNKSLRIKLAECVVPFATFQWNNLSYWLRQMQSNPRMIRYLEHTFGELSFRDIDDLQDERGVVNNSVMYQILSGGIKIGSGGMYFKLNPSYLDALNWFYGGPSNLLDRMVPSLQLPIRGFMQYAGMDSWNIFSDIDFAQTEEEWLQDVIKSIPILREAYTKYEHFAVNRNWEFLQSSGIQKTLVKFLPSTFGVTKVYENRGFDDFDEWLEELAEDDKWYDCNTGHIVDISLRNKKGLNNPKLSAEERKRLMFLNRGMLYDANVGHYVMPTHYTEGGLNKDWDFSKEGEWDEYQRLRKKYFGQVYDYNRHKFVKANKVTKGGLNDENLDWDSLCALNAEHNRYWDSNQGMFVQKKYLTTGGLNSKNMSFPALCAYQLAIFGKKWDIGKHKFVKVTDPVIGCKFNSKYEDWKVYNTLGFDTALVVPEKFTYMGKDGILRNMDGQYVLSDNEESNEKIFAKIREEYSYSSYGRYTRRYSYRSGWADGYAYNKVPVVPSKPYRNVIQSKGKAFNRPFTSSSNYSALRMAVSGYKAYDEYYKYDYNYNYSYRNPVRNTQLKRYDYRYHN